MNGQKIGQIPIKSRSIRENWYHCVLQLESYSLRKYVKLKFESTQNSKFKEVID